MESFFKLHVIPPPKPLDWSSPRSLLRDTLIHHLIQDPAPIGHFYIEVKSEIPNKRGVNHFLTGMSRAHRNLSSLKVMRDQVGLGTFFYDFPGTLDQGRDSLQKLSWARSRNRLKTLIVPLSNNQAGVLFDELEAWMKRGGYRHYGGGHRILRGEGSGCAEFGAHFLNLALGQRSVPTAWNRSVFAPKGLVGGARTGKKVSLLRVFREGGAWAQDEGSGFLYSTPDMELAWRWLESFSPGKAECILSVEDFGESRDPAQRIEFSTNYPEESEETLGGLWKRVSVT
jgi:hypothetical protein